MKRINEWTEDAVADRVGRMTPLGLVARVIGGVIVLSIVFSVIGFVGGWFGEARRQISPANVKAQWAFAYDYNESLRTIARQYCALDASAKAETDPSFKVQRESQALAVQNNYYRVQAVYDARLKDAFRAKYIRPSDVPAQAPSLAQEQTAVC